MAIPLNPIIIVGAGRSGSTLLSRILNGHPEIDFKGENSFLLPRVWNETWEDRFWLSWEFYNQQNPNSSCLPFPEYDERQLAAHNSRIAKIVANFIPSIINVDVSKKRWGWKEVWNGNKDFNYPWEIYHTVYPDAQWIHLIRNPIQFLNSVIRWNQIYVSGPKDIKPILEDWCQINRLSSKLVERQYFLVKFEDIIQEPVRTSKSLFEFIDLPWNRELLSPIKVKKMNSAQPQTMEKVKKLDFSKSELTEIVQKIDGFEEQLYTFEYELPEGVSLAVFEPTSGKTYVNLRRVKPYLMQPHLPVQLLEEKVQMVEAIIQKKQERGCPLFDKICNKIRLFCAAKYMKKKEALRFGFGNNWKSFIKKQFSDERLAIAKSHLLHFLDREDLNDTVFLDIGCGSGLHSLAALDAGAKEVIAFDYDKHSVEASTYLRTLKQIPEKQWSIQQGSILDNSFLEKLPPADIVYSWGVLHHTGNMWEAIKNAMQLVQPGALFYIALYDKTPRSDYWLDIKVKYNQGGWFCKRKLELGYYKEFFFHEKTNWLLRPRFTIRKIGAMIKEIKEYKKSRGMSFYTDVKDWLGGYPYECATVDEVVEFVQNEQGFTLLKVATGEANNEFLFTREV